MSDAETDSVEAWLEARPSESGRCGRLRCGTCVGEWHVEAYLGAGMSSGRLDQSRRSQDRSDSSTGQHYEFCHGSFRYRCSSV